MAPKKMYTPEQMGKAIEAVRNGEKIAKAAERFGVPRVTLHNKITGKSPLECSMGPATYLSKDEEHVLELWVELMSEKHIPVTKDELLDSVQKIISEKCQVTPPSRPPPFVNNRPGKKWYSLFLKRHPKIAERTAQNLTTARDNVTEQDIEKWFKEIEDYLQENDLKSVLTEPDRIFNTDESAFYLSPKPGKVLARRGDKHVYSSSGDEKDNLTVLITANAAGTLAPPMVVYSYERIPAAVSRKCPDNFGIGRSQTGWMCGATFYEYITNIFYPWLIKENIKRPILFFLDGHRSHLTLHLSDFCAENGIELIALYPNSTHLLQPMDLAVFRPLKLLWKKAVTKWKINNSGENLRKEDFAPLLQEALQNITEDSIKNGFRAGGLHPFGASYVDMSKIKSRSQTTQNQELQLQFLNHLEKEIINKLTAEKLQYFKTLFYKPRNELNDLLHSEDVSLYMIWASTKQAITFSTQTEDIDQLNTPNRDIADLPLPNESNAQTEDIDQLNTPNRDIADLPLPNESNAQTEDIDQLNTPNRDIADLPLPNESNAQTEDIDQLNAPNREIADLPLPNESNAQTEDIDRLNTPNRDIADLPLPNESNAQTEDIDQLNTPNRDIADLPLPNESNAQTEDIDQLNTPNRDIADLPLPNESNAQTEDIDQLNTPNRDIADLPLLNENQKTPVKIADFTNTYKSPMKIKGCIVPSPFKRNLHWPDEDEQTKGKKRRLKERLPFTVTSQAWREYHKKTEAEKQHKLEEKERKAKERAEKKMLKEKLMQEKRRNKTKRRKIDDTSSDDTETELQYCETDNSPYELEQEEEMSPFVTGKNIKTKKSRKRLKTNLESSESEDDEPLSKLPKSKRLSKGTYVIVTYESEYFPGIIENISDKSFEISTMTFSTGNTFKWPEKPDKIWYQEKDIIDVIDPPVLTNKRGFYTIKEMTKYLPFTV